MLHIAICDDEKDFVQYLTDLLNQYSKETGRDIMLMCHKVTHKNLKGSYPHYSVLSHSPSRQIDISFDLIYTFHVNMKSMN